MSQLINQARDTAVIRLRADQRFELIDQDGVPFFAITAPKGDILQRGGGIRRL